MFLVQKHDQDYIKKKNKATVFQLIKSGSPISRAKIAKTTGMSPTTVGRIVAALCEQGFVKEVKEAEEAAATGLGRKATLLKLDRTSVLTAGVELDKSKFKIGIVDFDGRIINLREVQREVSETVEQTMHRIAEELRAMIEQEQIEPGKIIGMGIGMPGIVDVQNGEVILSAQLGWRNIQVAKTLRELTGYEVAVDNELKVKALAEHCYGAAKGSKRTALIGFGSGVGSALIINGEIYRGETNSAGEIGHTIVDPNGVMCECGKIGCLQTYIAESSLIVESNKVKPISTLDELFEERRKGQFWAAGILDRAITYIGITIANVICLYNPDTVIVSGDLVEKYEEVRSFFKENQLQQYVWEPLWDTYRVVYSALGSEGVVIGSSLLAQDKFLSIEC
ncbi:ROK family protein [Paenibacillus sp. J2TS4]|uniref:ROK family protein n=1 Tax=Paenibacillus sp. J2TS4 TaxID=2807194 RepID=UPI001B135554|nr:ROK family protein [Paenibacillus sp. J2TS4]GIP35154.1 transcriptional regulator [Paenibacillus sp. J2TS4]